EKGSLQSETFKVMEQRLLRGIINPAMTLSWVFGLWLAWKGGWFSAGWLHAKLAAVILMSAVHGYLSGAVRKFAEARNEKPARHWRIVNEIPSLLTMAIINNVGISLTIGQALADRQRNPHIIDDRHRHSGDCETVLSGAWNGKSALLFAWRAAKRRVFLPVQRRLTYRPRPAFRFKAAFSPFRTPRVHPCRK